MAFSSRRSNCWLRSTALRTYATHRLSQRPQSRIQILVAFGAPLRQMAWPVRGGESCRQSILALRRHSELTTYRSLGWPARLGREWDKSIQGPDAMASARESQCSSSLSKQSTSLGNRLASAESHVSTGPATATWAWRGGIGALNLVWGPSRFLMRTGAHQQESAQRALAQTRPITVLLIGATPICSAGQECAPLQGPPTARLAANGWIPPGPCGC